MQTGQTMRIENEREEGDRDSVRVSLIVRSPLKDCVTPIPYNASCKIYSINITALYK